MLSPRLRAPRRAALLTGAAVLCTGTALASLTGCASSSSTGSPALAVVKPAPDAASPDASPTHATSAAASPTPSPSSTQTVTTLAAPIPATWTKYAKNIPAYPPDGGHGRRIVYSKALMYVWIVNADNTVAKSYPVTGRWDRPLKGTYHIYSMSTESMNAHSKASFRWMVRFAWGLRDESASIGFHSIPIFYEDNPARHAKQGDRMSKVSDLGLPVATGGCVRQLDANAEFLYHWAHVGDTVVVLPSP